MLTTQMYKGIIKPDVYSDELKERINRTLEMEDVVYPKDNSLEVLKNILCIAWGLSIVMFIYGVVMNLAADYFIFIVGFAIVSLFGIYVIQNNLVVKCKIDKMLIRYFDNLKDNEVYKYFGTLEELYMPSISNEGGTSKKSYFAQIDGHIWQINKEDYDKIEKLKTQKVNLYFVKYNNLGENATALMVTPKED